MGIYLIPEKGDAYDWLQNHTNLSLLNDEVVTYYELYRERGFVPLYFSIGFWGGFVGAIPCSLNEIVRWNEIDRDQEWYMIQYMDLTDNTGLSENLIEGMLNNV